MEEILASIRRIISDDESNSAKLSAAPQSQDDDEALEVSEGEAEGEADDKIINDIARVLSGGAPAPVEAVEEEEDILDLTAELGGLEPVEEEVQAVELVAEAEEPAPEPEFLSEPQELEAQPEPVEEEAPQPAEAASREPEVATEPALASRAMSASEEAASALERAIAALRAGQLPTSPIFSYEPPPFATPAEPAAEPAPEAAAQAPEPVFEPEGEPALSLTEFEAEMAAQEPSIFEVVVSEPEPEPEQGWQPEVPSWAAREQSELEPEYPALRTNGGHHQTYAAAGGEVGPKSLEDSVKDMLRPMLQKWLEENMTRVLTAALKDELRDNPARFDTD